MKKILRIGIIILLILGMNPLVYATGRFVDIPIPPNDKGKASFTSEEGEKQSQKYEKEQTENQTTAENFIGKSGNNNLKKIEVQGYQLEPEFNSQVYDYEVIIDKKKVKKINVIAEAEDTKAKVNGNGEIEIREEENIININVIAENGNLKVYTIKIADKTEKEESYATKTSALLKQESKIKDKWYYSIIVIIILLIVVISIKKITKRNKKRTIRK